MQTTNHVIPELLEMTKLTAHEKGLNNEIAVHLGEAEQKENIPYYARATS